MLGANLKQPYMIANNISEYIDLVKEITYSKNQTCWYRGHAKFDWELKPSVWRNYDRESEKKYESRVSLESKNTSK